MAQSRKKGGPLQGRGGLVAMGLVVLMGIWLWFDFQAPESRDPDELPRVTEYVRLRAGEVNRVEVRRGETSFLLAKQGKNWAFEKPRPYRAGSKSVEDWLKSLLDEATVTQTVAGKPSNLADYGLDKPQAEVVFTRGTETRTLQLGSDFRTPGSSTAGSSFYAREAKDGRLFLIGSLQADDIRKKKVEDFRDKRMFTFTEDTAVSRVVLRRQVDTLDVERQGSENWVIRSPFSAPADRFDVDSLVSGLREAQADGFADDAVTDLAKYGLDRPRLKAEVTLKSGVETVLFGADAPSSKVYAMREGEREVALLLKTTFDTLNKKPADLRERKLITLEREKIRTIEIKTPETQVRIQRSGENAWQYAVGPNGTLGPAKPESVTTILSSALAPAYRHVQEAPIDWKKYGLDAPAISVTLSDGSGAAQTLLLGKQTSGKQYYARGTANAVFEVNEFVRNDLNVKPDFFKPGAAPTTMPAPPPGPGKA
ncbi:MAG: DUF4340 domain-containing protein, partial [Armatimonadetes bacterium]|nr:DUF4340 domain-containing protein [Armatimonadota bacterium]